MQQSCTSWILNTTDDRPERGTALVAKELGRYSIDIVALYETHLATEGQLTEEGGCYIFWSGHSSDQHHEPGVGFAIKTILPTNSLAYQKASRIT